MNTGVTFIFLNICSEIRRDNPIHGNDIKILTLACLGLLSSCQTYKTFQVEMCLSIYSNANNFIQTIYLSKYAFRNDE